MSTSTAPTLLDDQSSISAVSWGAILAGATAAAALSLILFVLGSGLGLSLVSPWSRDGAGPVAMGLSTILWVTFTQLAASGMGGYLAGRLRTRWTASNSDEVYFRDTAHGFLSWAIASLVTATLLVSVTSSIIGGGVKATALTAGSAAAMTAAVSPPSTPGVQGDALGYSIDTLFRRDSPTSDPKSSTGNSDQANSWDPAKTSPEVTRIFLNAVRTGTVPSEDTSYVGRLVAQRTGLTQSDAEQRVTSTFERMQTQLRTAEKEARETADKARKASVYAALWLFISLLAGAFLASLAATFGGRLRDL